MDLYGNKETTGDRNHIGIAHFCVGTGTLWPLL
jgi:hypothetical protein